MSQLDKLNFLPHLFLFFLLFGFFYFIVFSYLLPLIFQSLQARSIFFNGLLVDAFSFNIFYYFFVNFYHTSLFDTMLKIFFSYLKQYKLIWLMLFTYSNGVLLKK